MNSRDREIAGVIIAPLVIPFVVFVFGASGAFGAQGVISLVAIFSSVIFSYSGMFILGLPAVYFLKRFGRFNLGWVLVAGVVGGAVVWFVFLELFSRSLESESGVSYLSIVSGAIMGSLVALTYGLIAGVRTSGRAI